VCWKTGATDVFEFEVSLAGIHPEHIYLHLAERATGPNKTYIFS
jgi:hypothetical protein